MVVLGIRDKTGHVDGVERGGCNYYLLCRYGVSRTTGSVRRTRETRSPLPEYWQRQQLQYLCQMISRKMHLRSWLLFREQFCRYVSTYSVGIYLPGRVSTEYVVLFVRQLGRARAVIGHPFSSPGNFSAERAFLSPHEQNRLPVLRQPTDVVIHDNADDHLASPSL